MNIKCLSIFSIAYKNSEFHFEALIYIHDKRIITNLKHQWMKTRMQTKSGKHVSIFILCLLKSIARTFSDEKLDRKVKSNIFCLKETCNENSLRKESFWDYVGELYASMLTDPFDLWDCFDLIGDVYQLISADGYSLYNESPSRISIFHQHIIIYNVVLQSNRFNMGESGRSCRIGRRTWKLDFISGISVRFHYVQVCS